jgi:hypothetical protein
MGNLMFEMGDLKFQTGDLRLQIGHSKLQMGDLKARDCRVGLIMGDLALLWQIPAPEGVTRMVRAAVAPVRGLPSAGIGYPGLAALARGFRSGARCAGFTTYRC